MPRARSRVDSVRRSGLRSPRMARLVLVNDHTADTVSDRAEELVAGVLYLAVEIRNAAEAGNVDRLRAESRRLANLTRLLEDELQR